jgi:hypothetical protein
MAGLVGSISGSTANSWITGVTGSLIVSRPGGAEGLEPTTKNFGYMDSGADPLGKDCNVFLSGAVNGKGATSGSKAYGTVAIGGDLCVSGALAFENISTPIEVKDKLYSSDNDLFWMGNKVLSGAGGGGSTSPGGSDTQLQYNNASSFGGITNVTTDGTDITKLVTDATNVITLESSYDNAGAIKLLTNAGSAEQITITNTQGTNAAAIDIDASAGGITIDSAGAFSIDGVGASNVTTNGVLTVSGSTGLNLRADSGEIDLTTRVGNIDINATAGGVTVDAATSIDLTSTEDSATSISITGYGMTFAGGDEDDSFLFNNSPISLEQISAPSSTTDKLYNVGGTLTWAGSAVDTGGGGGGSNTLNAAYDQGGAGVGAKITVDNQPVQMEVAGTLGDGATAMAVTGSALFGSSSIEFVANSKNRLPPLPGEDTSFYVSGAIAHSGSTDNPNMVQPSGRGQTVFGGDVVVSGSFPRTQTIFWGARVWGDVGTNSQAYWYRPTYAYGPFYYNWSLFEITSGITENDFDAPIPTAFSNDQEYQGQMMALFDATVTTWGWTASAFGTAYDDPGGISYIAALSHCRGAISNDPPVNAAGETPTIKQIGVNSVMPSQTLNTQYGMQITSSCDYKINKGDLIIPWTRRPYYDDGGGSIGTAAEYYTFTCQVTLTERFDGTVTIYD